jgi:hypothetical protein
MVNSAGNVREKSRRDMAAAGDTDEAAEEAASRGGGVGAMAGMSVCSLQVACSSEHY